MGFLWFEFMCPLFTAPVYFKPSRPPLFSPHGTLPPQPRPHEPSFGSHFIVTQAALENSPLVNTGRAVLAQSLKTRTMAGPQLEGAGEKVAK